MEGSQKSQCIEFPHLPRADEETPAVGVFQRGTAIGEAPRDHSLRHLPAPATPHGASLSELWRSLLPPLSPQVAVFQDSTLILLKVFFLPCSLS